jgi:hypothetical protein
MVGAGGGTQAAGQRRRRTVKRLVKLTSHPRVIAKDVQKQLVSIDRLATRGHAVLCDGPVQTNHRELSDCVRNIAAGSTIARTAASCSGLAAQIDDSS